MNRDKYIHNSDYREGYEDGNRECRQSMNEVVRNNVNYIILQLNRMVDELGAGEDGDDTQN